MKDSIEYELVEWEPREVWKCTGQCGRFRHRKTVKGILPAVCCGQPARLVDRYEQPALVTISEPLSSSSPACEQ
jgi:predicted metal-binding protein